MRSSRSSGALVAERLADPVGIRDHARPASSAETASAPAEAGKPKSRGVGGGSREPVPAVAAKNRMLVPVFAYACAKNSHGMTTTETGEQIDAGARARAQLSTAAASPSATGSSSSSRLTFLTRARSRRWVRTGGQTTAIPSHTILEPTEGTFARGGAPHTRPDQIRRRIGVLPESEGILSAIRRGDLRYTRALRQRRRARATASALLARVGLAGEARAHRRHSRAMRSGWGSRGAGQRSPVVFLAIRPSSRPRPASYSSGSRSRARSRARGTVRSARIGWRRSRDRTPS